MSSHLICTGCGNPLDGLWTTASEGTVRCPNCGAGNQVPGAAGEAEAGSAGVTTTDLEQAVAELRSTVLKRLGAIRNMVRDLASIDQEVLSAAAVVEAVRSEILTGHGPNLEPLDYHLIASQLSFVPNVMRRHGIDAVAENLEAVEALLVQLIELHQPQKSKHRPAADHDRTAATTRHDTPEPTYSVSTAHLGGPVTPSRRRAVAVAAGAVGLAVVAVVLVLLIRKPEPMIVNPDAVPVETPSHEEREQTPAVQHYPNPGAGFYDLIANAREAVRNGDPEAALPHLDAAAGLAGPTTILVDTATEVGSALLEAADLAMEQQRWQQADRMLATALDINTRLGISNQEVNDAIDRLAAAEWVIDLFPKNAKELQPLIGKQVIVHTEDHESTTGVIRELTGEELGLEVRGSVDGGAVVFETEITISSIESLRHTVESKPVECMAARERAAASHARPRLVDTTLTNDDD